MSEKFMFNDANLNLLLAAYLSGDLLPEERAAVEQRLAEDTAFCALSQELSELLTLLKQGERQVSPAMIATLRARLTHSMARSPRVAPSTRMPAPPPTVRVYATHATSISWRRLWIVGLASAAAIAMIISGAIIFNLMKETKSQNELAIKNSDKSDVSTTKQLVAPESDIILPTTKISPSSEVAGNILPMSPKKEPSSIKQSAPTSLDKTASSSPEKSRAPKSPQPDMIPPSKIPNKSPDVEVAEPKIKPSPSTIPPLIKDAAPIANHTSTTNHIASNPTTTSVTTASNLPTKTPTAENATNNPTTPAPNLALVDSIKGVVLANTPTGIQTLAMGNSLPSGSEIVTDQGRVILALPDNGRLGINSNSSLTFELRSKGIFVTLNAGEISYQGANLLTVIAGNINITNAKSVNIKRDGNQITAAVMAKTAHVGAKGKTILVKSGFRAIVALNSDTLPRVESFIEQPNLWTIDLTQPDTNLPKTPTNDIEKQKKSQANSRRGR